MAGLSELSGMALAARAAKVRALRLARLLDWRRRPERFPAPQVTDSARLIHRIWRAEVSLESADPHSHDPVERRLEAGKRHNVALAAASFDGIVVAPNRPLSFWRTLGRATAARGFRVGRELRAGCIVPAMGGGLCLLSNQLFAAACELGWTVLERHGHTLDSGIEPTGLWGLDATVFWPFVDLRIAPTGGVAQIRTRVIEERLILEVVADEPTSVSTELVEQSATRQGARRQNQIQRRVFDRHSGQLLTTESVASNDKRVMRRSAATRNCYTCHDGTCLARKGILRSAGHGK